MNVSSATAADTVGSQAAVQVGGSTLGQQDFLQLLVTQLQHQDPLEPQPATEFTAQLAQFSSLEQLMNVNTALQQLASFQAAVANTQTASFIGREVTAVGTEIRVAGGQASHAALRLDSAADAVQVTIRDATGSAVRVIDLGPLAAGTHDIGWDGTNTAGLAVPDGTYSFEISAAADGEEVAALPLTSGLVEGVEFEEEGTFLIIGGRRVALANIIGIRAVSGGA